MIILMFWKHIQDTRTNQFVVVHAGFAFALHVPRVNHVPIVDIFYLFGFRGRRRWSPVALVERQRIDAFSTDVVAQGHFTRGIDSHG